MLNNIFLGFIILGIVLICTSKIEGQHFPCPDGKFFGGLFIIVIVILLKVGTILGKIF